MSRTPDRPCPFCAIVAGTGAAAVVQADDLTLAFLDQGPLAHGHVLVIPKQHTPTLLDLPDDLSGPFFLRVKRVAAAVERALQADGVFVASNVRISQSVPHLHVHVVPRWRDDKLFSRNLAWPRRPYRDQAHREAVRASIAAALRAILDQAEPA